jgi:hypothetical protein
MFSYKSCIENEIYFMSNTRSPLSLTVFQLIEQKGVNASELLRYVYVY